MTKAKPGEQYLSKLQEVKDILAGAQKVIDQIDVFDMKDLIDQFLGKPNSTLAAFGWALEVDFVCSLAQTLEKLQQLIKIRLELWRGHDEE
ncbi:MAG: hypothetical protein QXH03_08320 [Candidatus Bathyarchaeia archaeon]